MMPHKTNPKKILNFFPIFFLVYEKKIHVKNNDYFLQNLSIIIIVKIYQDFIFKFLF
jgi:hypothetical protein